MYYNNSDVEDMLEEMFASTAVMTMIIVVFLIAFLILAILYVLNSIGLYRMAKKVGNNKAWLAWIPYANIWLMFTLPSSEYRVLAINKVINDRSNAFWIFIAISYGTSIVISVLSALPFIGWLFALVSPLASIVTILTHIFMMFPVYKSLYAMFLPESSAQNYAIGSIICAYLMPIVTSILMLIVSGKEPIMVEEPIYDQQYYGY
ncbi:MAG: hypothetical protein NC089_12025 [Bacteroides sp.]|nr:hypothetical protein [Bacteroides sp.]MCM1550645.1 hypothetical protein [Clostridium sp.]